MDSEKLEGYCCGDCIFFDHYPKGKKTCKAQALGMLKNLEKSPGKMPRTFEGGKLVLSGVNWWCSGFYPGTLWYLYEYYKSDKIKVLAEKFTEMLGPVQYLTDNHDIGFQIFCSFGNGLPMI